MYISLLYCTLAVFISTMAFSQSIRENLDFVNDQFSRYNSLNIVCNIDSENKALVIYDDFGTSVCYFEDVEFDYAEDSRTTIEVKCIDEDECFDQKKNDEYFNLEKYAIELSGGNLDKIIDKLNEIKEIVLNED